MKISKISLVSIILFFMAFTKSYSQDRIYTESANEIIFSFADVVNFDRNISTPARFSMFFHAGSIVHFDLNDYVGMYTGYGLRNIGFITEENNIKTKRRTYSLGVPVALKIGLFQNNFYVYGGASYEMFFHYKQKQFINGNKEKMSEWFSDRTDRFAPSIFAGVQLPHGFNLKFKYYPNDFLNKSFVGEDFGEPVDYGSYSKTNLFYIGISYVINPKEMREKLNPGHSGDKVAYFEE